MQAKVWATDQPKKSTVAAEWVLKLIQSNSLGKGARLPSEREIAQELSMSRPPIREALSALQIAGIIEIRPGEGSFVKSPGMQIGSVDRIMSMLAETESPFEVMQARFLLEQATVKEAAAKATDKDIEVLQEVVQRMKNCLAMNNLEDYFQANREFHLAIAAASQNTVLVRLIRLLLTAEHTELWRGSIQRYVMDPEHIGQYVSRHERILNAIKARNKAKATQEMADHFSQTVDEVREYI